MSDAAANNALVVRFIAAWERRDTDAILECFADDGLYHAMPLPPIEGKAALAEWVASFAGKPPGRLVVHNQAAAGNVVINERTDYVTLNDKPVTLPICAVFELDGGRIKAWREYFDTAPAREAFK